MVASASASLLAGISPKKAERQQIQVRQAEKRMKTPFYLTKGDDRQFGNIMKSQQNFRKDQVGEINYTVEMNTIQNSWKSFMFDQERKKLTDILKEFEENDRSNKRTKK